MPRKSGVLFYRQLKSDPKFREIPVVVVTGLTRGDRDTELVVRTFLEVEHVPPPVAYLEKPVSAGEFLETVGAAVERNPAKRAGSDSRPRIRPPEVSGP
jgi:CheY-like chemotaxis protein